MSDEARVPQRRSSIPMPSTSVPSSEPASSLPPRTEPRSTAFRRSSEEPEPPVILAQQAPATTHAPYASFLSSAPPPPDSWIEVETTQSAYRLHVRLPGFSREGITLATKRRSILHVVADSWDNGGGHFERRIAFGSDADLVRVRAEFDGVMLTVTIPRRISWHCA